MAKDAGIDLEVVEGGSITNVKKMRWQHGVKLAIVQSDVLEYYRREARKGKPNASDLIQPLRVIMPLYNEEVHMITRTYSDIHSFHDIKGKKIALGKAGGGSAMTGLAIYNYMFGEDISFENAYFSSFNDALKAVANGDVDVWIMVVGQPTKKFADMPADAKEFIRFVKFDPNDSIDKKILDGPYYQTKINKESYDWLDEDIASVTVKSFLITQKYTRQETKRNIERFTRSLCRNFSKLQENGHPKWKEVASEKTSLPGGWQYSEDVLRAFSSSDCKLGTSNEPCAIRDRILGVCE